MNKHKRTFTGGTLQEAGLILILSIGTALAVNFFRTDGLSIFSSPPPRSEPIENPVTATSDALQISIEEAIRHHQRQSALFLDARTPEDYARGHISGAISFPDRLFDEKIGPFLEDTPPETILITYCEGERCHLSQSLAENLHLAGYEKVYHVIDGLGEWKRRNLPVETE